jgi:predicted amidohydrolase YtcJ
MATIMSGWARSVKMRWMGALRGPPHGCGGLQGTARFRGKGRFTDAELQDMVDTSARLGWQMGLHCIGDAAIVQTINAYDRSLNSIADKEHVQSDRRWFTDHFTMMPPMPPWPP